MEAIVLSPGRDDLALLLKISLQLAFLVAAVTTLPEPGRIPKVYNALITSSQNLEPSKAYPVYQPVLQDFAFPYQPTFFYSGDLQNFFSNPPVPIPKEVGGEIAKETPSTEASDEKTSTEVSSAPEADAEAAAEPDQPQPSEAKPDEAPPAETARASDGLPPPPSTQSPIPLNEFGLPPAVVPLGRLDPAYNGFTQISQLSPFYNYPTLRFYDPFDPFSFSQYTSFPTFYKPIPNALTAAAPEAPPPSAAPAPAAALAPSTAPPAEPNDLNLLNYSSKDPTIPNVPPPPLPHGGLKSDKA